MLKRVGLKLHPCLTSWPVERNVCVLPVNCTLVCVDGFYNGRMFLNQHHFSSICKADPHAKMRKAFLKSTMHEKTLPLF
jgi:hypothetical protein